jgi:hypothetical protein
MLLNMVYVETKCTFKKLHISDRHWYLKPALEPKFPFVGEQELFKPIVGHLLLVDHNG